MVKERVYAWIALAGSNEKARGGAGHWLASLQPVIRESSLSCVALRKLQTTTRKHSTVDIIIHRTLTWRSQRNKPAAAPPPLPSQTTAYLGNLYAITPPYKWENKKAQLTQRERATAVHVWRPTVNKCKIRKNLYFSAQGHSRSLLLVSIETRVWLPISD